ncbi:MAG: flagellar biosynthesis protein FlhB [Candidatus Krumholzibacteriota bacterium]|nr:flagellar biosynthesis protein FlhB [Candidatus Krumholzibacteriota bacterium]
MADTGGQEKTELATQRRRRDARKKGQVARSVELSSFLLLLAGVLGLAALAPGLGCGLVRLMVGSVDAAFAASVTVETLPQLSRLWVGEGLRLVMPLWVMLLVVGTGAAVAQVGFQVNGDLLAPKPERINPISGFKRIFSKRSGFEFGKSLFKMALLMLITWMTLRGEAQRLMGLADLPLAPALGVVGTITLKLAGRLILLMVVLALADYAFQRWQFEKDIMMTRQELKEEYKETEGDPILRARLRALQRDIAVKRMMEDVKRSDVVVTNPTHFAVALLYEEGMAAPSVAAKGADRIAERIKEVAREHDVPVVENPPLARALYAECKLGQMIPLKFFQAVAELLAYVYQVRRGATGGR